MANSDRINADASNLFVVSEEPSVTEKDNATARDRELVKRVQKGDKQAFQSLMQAYEARLHRLVTGIVRNEEDAKDVIQEVFVKIYLSINEFRGQSSFFTWAYRVTFNLAVDWKRKYGRIAAKTESQSDEATETYLEQLPSGDVSADEIIHQKEQRKAINEALGEMSVEQRSVVVLRDVDGLSYDEISTVTGLPKGTVMSRLFYGRKRLMELLTKFRIKDGTDTSNTAESGITEDIPQKVLRGEGSKKEELFRGVGAQPLRPLKSAAGN